MVQVLSIRTKLIIAMLAFVASVALMGVTADAANAAVTDIQTVHNFSPYFVYVWNHEHNGPNALIFPRSSRSYNQWVPWATNKDEFNAGHYIEFGFDPVSIGDGQPPCGISGVTCPQYAIWQEYTPKQPYPGDLIRYVRPGCDTSCAPPDYMFQYTTSAPPMPGIAQVGGERDLFIWSTEDPRGFAIMHAYLGYPR
jgi:hypothetical protein